MLKEIFALSNQGEKDLKKGILASAAANISLLFPAGLLLLSIRDLMMYIEKQAFNKPFCEPVPGKKSYFCHTL